MPGIGDLVAYLSLDNQQFKKGAADARSTLKSFAGNVRSIIAPVAGAMAGIWGTSASLAAFKTQLASEQQLASVLSATGGAAGLTGEEIKAYAGELQSLTNFGDEVTLSAAAMLGTFTNIKGDMFKDAIASAQDLSAVFGTGLPENIKKVGKALNDPAAGMASLAEQGVVFTEQQRDQVKALQEVGDIAGAQSIIMAGLQDRVGGAARAMADPWTQLMNTVGDIGENIGAVLMPTIIVVAENVQEMIGGVASGADAFLSLGVTIADTLKNAGGYLVLWGTQAELAFVKIGLDAGHFFTEALPVYLDWLGKNWHDVFFTAGDFAMTVFINLGENIRGAWDALLSYFSGNPVQFDWKPLTEGFASAIKSLPDIPERVTTEFEKSLTRDVDAISQHLKESSEKTKSDLMARFKPMGNLPAPNLGSEEQNAIGTQKAAPKTELRASLRGSSEAASILLRGVGGGKTMEQIAQKQLTALMGLQTAVKANKPEPIMVADF